ncbi:phosphoribosylanthranilate isomerase [bacterium]|nr:phosphoribosylanthranilate isomerase [bacterium]
MKSVPNHDSAPVPATGADRVRMKVCGVTQPRQATALRQMRVDFLGLNFHPPSPRFIEPEIARSLVEAWGEPASSVGVFVDRSAEEILACQDIAGFGIAQLHGSESSETIVAVARRLPVIRAFRVQDSGSLEVARRQIDAVESAGVSLFAVLIDGYSPNAHGGTGQTVAEDLVRQAVALHPRLILAGGLRPGNLAERLKWIRPWCVDVASGVESAPGIKDLAAVEVMWRCIREISGDLC